MRRTTVIFPKRKSNIAKKRNINFEFENVSILPKNFNLESRIRNKHLFLLYHYELNKNVYHYIRTKFESKFRHITVTSRANWWANQLLNWFRNFPRCICPGKFNFSKSQFFLPILFVILILDCIFLNLSLWYKCHWRNVFSTIIIIYPDWPMHDEEELVKWEKVEPQTSIGWSIVNIWLYGLN